MTIGDFSRGSQLLYRGRVPFLLRLDASLGAIYKALKSAYTLCSPLYNRLYNRL